MPKKKRNSNILEMEKRLDELVSTDIYNEEIYKLLKDLAYIYIHQNKYNSIQKKPVHIQSNHKSEIIMKTSKHRKNKKMNT